MIVFSLTLLQIFGINGIILGYTFSLAIFGILIFKGFREGEINFKLLKDRKNFVVNSYATHVLEVININIDKIIIFPVFGALILGPYQLGFQIFALSMILPKIVTQYTLPHDASGTKNNKLKTYTVISSTIITVLTVILAPIVLPELFPKYNEVIQVIQIMAIAIIPASLTLIITSEFLGNEKSRKVSLSSIVSMTSLSIGIIVLGEYYGLIGMSISLVIAKSLQCAILLILRYKKII